MQQLNEQQIEEATQLFRNALTNGWHFVLCVRATDPNCAVRQTNMTPKQEAKMLRKFAKRAEEWV